MRLCQRERLWCWILTGQFGSLVAHRHLRTCEDPTFLFVQKDTASPFQQKVIWSWPSLFNYGNKCSQPWSITNNFARKKKSWAHLKGVPTFPEYWDEYLSKVCTWSNSVSPEPLSFPPCSQAWHLLSSLAVLQTCSALCLNDVPLFRAYSFLHSPESSPDYLPKITSSPSL